MAPGSDAFAVLDSSFLVGYCVKTDGKIEEAETALLRYGDEGRQCVIPGIAIGETIWSICKMEKDARITVEERDAGLDTFQAFCTILHDSPSGDLALVPRTLELRKGFGPNWSYDAVFLALADSLSNVGDTVLATFDRRMSRRAARLTPNVHVHLLTGTKSAG